MEVSPYVLFHLENKDTDGLDHCSFQINDKYKQIDVNEYNREYSHLTVNQYGKQIKDFNHRCRMKADLMEQLLEHFLYDSIIHEAN